MSAISWLHRSYTHYRVHAPPILNVPAVSLSYHSGLLQLFLYSLYCHARCPPEGHYLMIRSYLRTVILVHTDTELSTLYRRSYRPDPAHLNLLKGGSLRCS